MSNEFQTLTRFAGNSAANKLQTGVRRENSFAHAIVSLDTPGKESSNTLTRQNKPYSGRIKDFPLPDPRLRNRYFKEKFAREGVVTSVSEDGFYASLCERYQQVPAEEAFIPFDEVDKGDRNLITEGSKFFWRVGYLVSQGQQYSISHIEFRRSPAYTPKQLEAARAKAQEYASLFP